MKTLIFGTLALSSALNALAAGKSVGPEALEAAKLVNQPSVSRCIQKVESDHHASASIRDLRIVDRDAGKFELTLFLLRGGDIAVGEFDLELTHQIAPDFGFNVVHLYECKIISENL